MGADRHSPTSLTGASPGDIVLFYGARGLSRFISLFTRSPFYHVAIAADQSEIIEAVPKGVMRTSIGSRRNPRFVVIPEASIGRTALKWAEAKIGDGYDPTDLLAIVLDRMFRHLHINLVHGDRFTCGEFVATAFANAGLRLFPDIDSEAVVPADFARLLQPETRASVK